MPKSKSKKEIPHFPSEEAERAFWAEQDSVEYFDWAQAHPAILPKLRPTLQTQAGYPGREKS